MASHNITTSQPVGVYSKVESGEDEMDGGGASRADPEFAEHAQSLLLVLAA